MTPDEELSCPVVEYRFRMPPEPALRRFARMDRIQDTARPAAYTRDAAGYWIFTDQEVIFEALQRPELWSSSSIVVETANPPFTWIPLMLDPPANIPWRRLLAGYFAPARVKAMVEDQRRLAAELIESLRGRGECDFVAELGRIFPSLIFLEIMGMPRSELAKFLHWEDMILHQNDQTDPDRSKRMGGMASVGEYFAGLIAERRANPDPEARDVVSAALDWQIDGKPARTEEILNCLLLLFLAGLDTVAGQSSYMFLHLATHPEHRRRIAEDPAVIPRGVEELLRAYPIVQTARKATRDEEFHGCPVRAGEMALFSLSAAGRDESAYSSARSVDLDRANTRHLSFGTGAHMCLGAHLARQELAILLEEWHRVIPEYELVEPALEHGGGVWGLTSLRLRWKH